MPATAAVIQADNLYLRRQKVNQVQAAIDQLVAVGLVRLFEHQGEAFVWQPDWQKWQGIRYPRTTVNPAPPAQALQELADNKTRELFGSHSEHSQIDFSENVKTDPQPARAGGRETLTHTLTLTQTSDPKEGKSAREGERDGRVLADGGAWRPAGPYPRAGALVDGSAQRRHGNHAWCADRDGLCVPQFLHEEFCGKLGGDMPSCRLNEWYPTVIALFQHRAIGEDALIFWRNNFATWVGTATTRPSGRESLTASTLRAAREVLSATDDSARLEDGRGE
jgi:hypothetical protein